MAAITVNLKPFSTKTANAILQSLTGYGPMNDGDQAAAEEICHRVGALPLALVQLSEFMRDRSFSYSELLEMYKNSPETVYRTSGTLAGYEGTVLTTWDTFLRKLSANGRALLSLLACLHPGPVPETLLTNQAAKLESSQLSFLLDEFE